jgi:predicted acyltransferase
MLLVNNPGSWERVYPPLQHAAWNGATLADLVFPFFLIIVGVAATFSLGSMQARGLTPGQRLRRAAVRALVIFALGLVLQGFPHYDLAHLRLLGVLQRIAISYLVAATIVTLTGVRGQAGVLIALLLGYWALLVAVPVPGVGRGALEPDLNLANWLDFHVIGANHLLHDTGTWDPEGLLSTLGAIATTLCGFLLGHWIRSARPAATKIWGLSLAGGFWEALGLAWDEVLPINKSLWTGSYVLYSAGIACLLLAGLHWLVDVKGRRRWAQPFLVFGTNAIVAYWLSSLVAIVLEWIVITGPGEGEARVLRIYLDDTLFASWLPATAASLAYATSYVLLWLGLLGLLYRRRIFIRI